MVLNKLGKELLILDGGMGTLLQREGLLAGELPENWNMEKPEVIRRIHQAYFEAGSDIVLTNTFGANCKKYYGQPYTIEEVVFAAVEKVKMAAQAAGKKD